MHDVVDCVLMRHDSAGYGHYNADRGSRKHNGVDVLVEEGQDVYSPIDGIITRFSYPGKSKAWQGLYIQGTGAWKGYGVKIFYMSPSDYVRNFLNRQIPIEVAAGTKIGEAQAISKKYPHTAMKNHLHLELRKGRDRQDKAINPEKYIQWTNIQ